MGERDGGSKHPRQYVASQWSDKPECAPRSDKASGGKGADRSSGAHFC